VRGKGGYVGADGVPRLNVLDLQARILISSALVPMCALSVDIGPLPWTQPAQLAPGLTDQDVLQLLDSVDENISQR
jgi:hypothetical protein